MPKAGLAAEPTRTRVGGREVDYHVGDAGNPHAVVFVDEDLDAVDVAGLGSAMQAAPPFDDGVNVEFVRVLGERDLAQRTWERGSGETLACGSGATVAALTAMRTGRVQPGRIRVRLRGGDLWVSESETGTVLEGPARTVFRGEVDA